MFAIPERRLRRRGLSNQGGRSDHSNQVLRKHQQAGLLPLIGAEEMKLYQYILILLILGAVALVVLLNRERWLGNPAGQDTSEPVTEDLADLEVKSIIEKQRAARSDLPKPFPKSEWVVTKQGSYYSCIEYGLPKAPGFNQVFKLNRHGVIVDAYNAENPDASIDCPQKIYSVGELAAIVERERKKRNDLPAKFPELKTRVDRMRCLYYYFEYEVPDTQGKHHVFVIDPFGELMEVFPASTS